MLVCLLAGCGTGAAGGGGAKESSGGGGGRDSSGEAADDNRPSTAGTFESPTARPSAPPTGEDGEDGGKGGKGGKDPDDLNGDGHRDFLTVATPPKEGATGRPTIVWGSADGLDTDSYTTYSWADLGFDTPEAWRSADDLGRSGIVTADLDSDGYPELISGSKVAWGGPQGPRKGAGATSLVITGGTGAEEPQFTRGDFNGDGHHDLAALQPGNGGSDSAKLLVLYGPFSRDGRPDHSESRAAKEGTLQADAIDPTGGHRPTALLTRVIQEGEQVAPTRYTAGPEGLSREGEELRAGNGSAFGDFDGDGKRDLIVGDTGTANDELTEEDEKDGGKGATTATFYPGGGGEDRTFDLPEYHPGESPNGPFATLRTGAGKPDGLLVPARSGAVAMEVPDGRRVRTHRTVRGTVDGKELWKYDHESTPTGTADFDGDGRDETVMSWLNTRIHRPGDAAPSHWWIVDPWKHTNKKAFSTVPYAGQ
ncbi:hypothetical protein B1H18_14320 [Streptomyces tsukubensis]|uniref:VCBS repeat-containing protein n=1 Tax=Streptomyces tsukubensis TaxID=83656 RepID=A0A1V4A8N1_9ACTN|nr:hypothetical protein B1H18_14320 [Streptomyces tsukubensis]